MKDDPDRFQVLRESPLVRTEPKKHYGYRKKKNS